MPNLVRHILISPRTWLAIGAFCIGTSFLLGYHLDQQSADRVLAQKVGRPAAVLVQDFIPERHMNILNEVHAIGQMVDGESVRVNIGSNEEPRWIDVTPIHAVGSGFKPVADAHLNATHGRLTRPMPRDAAEGLRRQRLEIESIASHALAFAIEEVPATDIGTPAAGPFRAIDESGSIRLVEIFGAVVTGNRLRDTVSDALLAAGVPSVPDSLLIAPTAITVTTHPSDTLVEGLSWWLALAGATLALVAMVAPRISSQLASMVKKSAPVPIVEAHGSFPAIGLFQPIASQDELLREEERTQDEKRTRSESSASRLIRRRLSRFTDFAASSFGGVRSPR